MHSFSKAELVKHKNTSKEQLQRIMTRKVTYQDVRDIFDSLENNVPFKNDFDVKIIVQDFGHKFSPPPLKFQGTKSLQTRSQCKSCLPQRWQLPGSRYGCQLRFFVTHSWHKSANLSIRKCGARTGTQ